MLQKRSYASSSAFCFFALLLHLLLPVSTPASSPSAHDDVTLDPKLAPVAAIVNKAIRNGKTPGAVVLIGHEGKIVYRRAFGYRSTSPLAPMTGDTVFDLASLTKPVATATAIMQLVEQGKLDLDAPVHHYWPAFKARGKQNITVRQLLTHYSGLRPDLRMRPVWTGYSTAMGKIISERPVIAPGSGYIYSDINFEVLGELVKRVSGMTLDRYCEEHIFKPLGMNDTGFKPAPDLRDRIAPTEYVKHTPLCGTPHDPTCSAMGGVAGHAGLFSTADDLALFAQTLLDYGAMNGRTILRRQTVELMTSLQSPPGKEPRGLGWALEPSFASNGSQTVQMTVYGHLGYTGTALWIDPLTKTYVILLTNRVYPYGKGDVKELRAEIKELVSKTLGPTPDGAPDSLPVAGGVTGKGVLTGIDVLQQEGFALLSGRRVGLITNHTGLDSLGRHSIDLFHDAPGVSLAAVFSPEHGLSGKEEKKVPPMLEPATGLPVHSLYGTETRPTDEMLDGLDALVFDIQDAGTRFYTYISTMGYAMEAAAKKGIPFYVLDRPNPVNALFVQGPVMDDDLKCFTGYFPLPIRHGMTVGELAMMFNSEGGINVELHVVPMKRYHRGQWYDETGLKWVPPSPNIRSLTEEILYPGVGLVEGANVSVGRGTDTPFEVLGAPWINGQELSRYLNNRGLAGVSFAPVKFVPKADRYKGKVCRGVRITLGDRQSLDSAALGVGLAHALHRLYPEHFQIDQTLALVGSREVVAAIKSGKDADSLAELWMPSLEKFLIVRSRYLLYQD